MRKISTLILLISGILLFPMTIKGQNNSFKAPDFAFPQTVEETASEHLRLAEETGNATEAMLALLEISKSRELIDRNSLPQSIRLVEAAGEKFNDSQIAGLFPLLQARLMMKYLDYNPQMLRREIPLRPLPEDMSEWSWEQVTDYVDSLCNKAYFSEYGARLASCPITEYREIIDCDSLSAVFFPTLRDFAAFQVYNVTQNDEIQSRIEESVMCDESVISPNKLYWQLTKANEYDEMKALYEKYTGESYAGIILVKMGETLRGTANVTYRDDLEIADQNEKLRTYKAFTDAYLAAFPENPFAETLGYYIGLICKSQVDFQYSKVSYTGVPLRIVNKTANITEYTVKVYKLSDNITSGNELRKDDLEAYFASLVPFKTMNVAKTETIPFVANDTLHLTLQEPGTYALWLDYDGMQTTQNSIDVVCNYPVFPVALNETQRGLMIITDPVTGAPVKGCKIKIVDNGRMLSSAKSGSNGIAEFPKSYNSDGWARYDSRFSYRGGEYLYKDYCALTVSKDDEDEETTDAQILTDLGIYHPGDTVKFLVITSKYQSKRKIHRAAEGIELQVILHNANRKPIDTICGVTDRYGRMTGEFKLPAEGLTGQFTLRVTKKDSYIDYNSDKRFMVSDYRLSDFEVVIDNPVFDTPNQGDVTIKGNLTTYSGMPVSNAEVSLSLRKAFRWSRSNDNPVIETLTMNTDSQGRFCFVVPASSFADEGQDQYFSVTIDAVSPAGVTVSADRRFMRANRYWIEIDCNGHNINGELPFNPTIKVHSENGDIEGLPLVWTLEHDGNIVASGTDFKDIELSSLRPDQYIFNVRPADDSVSANPGFSEITIYNIASGICPGSEHAWFQSEDINAGTASSFRQLIAAAENGTTVYAFLTDDGNILDTKVMKVDAGYKWLDFNLPRKLKAPILILLSQKDGNLVGITNRIIQSKREDNPNLVVETMRDRLIPGSEETWRISFNKNGAGLESAVVMDMYNKALDKLAGNYNRVYFRNYNRIIHAGYRIQYDKTGRYIISPAFEYRNVDYSNIAANFRFMDFYNRYLNPGLITGRMEYCLASPTACLNEVVSYDSMPMKSRAMATGAAADDCEEECVVEETAGNSEDAHGEAPADQESFSYRESYVPLALWEPNLNTDGHGNLVFTFHLPDANTTWRLSASAWTKDLEYGSVVREFIASKPVMVQPNLPRFLRCGDTTSLRATVYNNSDTDAEIHTVIELFNPVNGEAISTVSYSDTIEQNGNRTYAIPYAASQNIPAVGFRVRAKTDIPEGKFSDGEQSAIPLLTNSAILMESRTFYMNPGETSYEQVLPSGTDMNLTLSFCQNPEWTIVSALPGLRAQIYEYANSAAAAIFSAAVSKHIIDSNPVLAETLRIWTNEPENATLVAALEKNDQLKIATLTSTPWVQAAESDNERMQRLALLFNRHEIDAAIDKGISILDKLQRTDGGWAWGTWCRESSIFITGNVLAMCAELKQAGCLPSNPDLRRMIEKAIGFYDSKVNQNDLVYAIIRPHFSEIPMSEHADSVMSATLDNIAVHWRDYTDPAMKSMCAEAAWVNDRHDLARLILTSVSQFGVSTANQGMRFPSINSLAAYCNLLDAYASINPDAPEIDAIRQQLIVRKQATDWGNAVVTTEVIAAILNSGTDFLAIADSANSARVLVDGIEIDTATDIERATGQILADISRYAGKTLKIVTPGIGPSYGAVLSRFTDTMQDVAAVGSNEISIEKRMYVRRDGRWDNIDSLSVGDRVKTQLLIHCNRKLDYVTVVDERAACLEPVKQLPGWVWSEGASFYRENRDASTNLFIEWLRPGTYMLEYEFNIAQSGTYASGVATIQSQYAPEITAHSSGCIIQIKD